MGRVYEALNKADRAPAIAEADRQKETEDLPLDRVLGGPSARDFDFVPYSLEAPSLPEIHRIKREQDLASESRIQMTQVSRTVELDQRRLDRRLTPSYESPARISEEFNKAAIATISAASDCPIKRILVTSVNHGSGKTVTAINLAFALAKARKRVLLIDCDLERPSILRMLALEADIGLSELTNTDVRPGDGAIRIMPSGVTVIPMRAPVEHPAELLGNQALQSLLAAFEPDYDFMVFDSGPLPHSPDARLLARLTDRAILVISAGTTNSSQLAKAVGVINKEQVLGVVLNRLQERPDAIN